MGLTYTLVTGASMGIGAELARVAARNRRNVILTARSADKLEDLANELRNTYSIDAVVIGEDLGSEGGAARLWNAATAEDRKVDFLINNAGLGSHGAFTEGDWAREKASIDVNVTALTELCKLAIPHLADLARGRILNVASVAGFVPGPNMAVYHATKAYVLNLSLALSEELSDTKISVTALCPGATQSNFFADAGMQNVRLVKSGRLPTSKDVAEYGYGAAIAGYPVAVPGLSNKGLVMLTRILPRTWAAKITASLMASS